MLSTNTSEETKPTEWKYYVWSCENTHYDWRPSGKPPEPKCGFANIRKSKKRLGIDKMQDWCKNPECKARKNLNPSTSKISTFFTLEDAQDAQNALNGGEEE